MKELGGLLPLLLIAVVFYLLLIRPQRRRQLELMATQRGLAVGDEVMLAAGIVAVIRGLPEDDDLLEVEVAPGVHLRVARGAVARVLRPSPDAPEVGPTAPGAAIDPAEPGPNVP